MLKDGVNNAVELDAAAEVVPLLLPFELGMDDDECWNAPKDFLDFFDENDEGGVSFLVWLFGCRNCLGPFLVNVKVVLPRL